jgi:peptidoglycan/LPS O-acetylase OafA/YrhL
MQTVAFETNRPSTKSSTRQAFRPDVQGLRAVAVGLVVLNHAHIQALTGGFVGVDVFFVISGFLITGLLLVDAGENGRVSFATFYTRRALRILPAATVVTVATALVSVHVLNFVRAKAVLTDSIWATFFAANVHFGQDGTNYFASDQPLSPLQHYWSLAVEEQFYVVWPAILALVLFGVRGLMARGHGQSPKRGHRALLRGRVVLVLVAVGAWSLYASVQQTATDQTGAYFSTFTRAWELVAGGLLATLLPALGRLPISFRVLLSWAGLAGIGIAAMTFDPATPFPGIAALLPVLSASAIIAGGVDAPRHGASMLLATRPFNFIGNISFSLYLWHWPVLILGAAYAGHALTTWQNLGLAAVAVVLSVASYSWIENPFRHTRLWRSRPHTGMLLYPIAMSSVLLVALLAQPASPFALANSGSNGPSSAGNASAAVKASVLDARRGAAIPAVLYPSIEKVKDDFKSYGDCSGYKKASSKICQFGDPQGSKRMVVFGDSHSAMWIPALTANANKAQWQFMPVVKEACSYTDYIGIPKRNQCTDWYAWAKGTIKNLHPDLIVMSVYVLPGWERGVQQIVTELKALGARVLLLSDAPGVNVASVDCLLTKNASQGTCVWNERPVYRTADKTAQSIAERSNIEFVKTSQWFCYQQSCPSIIHSTVAYADVGHITGTYARYLAPDLNPYLKLD